jgi:hypothetical protein
MCPYFFICRTISVISQKSISELRKKLNKTDSQGTAQGKLKFSAIFLK